MKSKAIALALLVTSNFLFTPQANAQNKADAALAIGATAVVGGIAAALIAGELQEQHRNRLEQMAVNHYLKNKYQGGDFTLEYIEEASREDDRGEVSVLAFVVKEEGEESSDCNKQYKPKYIVIWFLDDSWINDNALSITKTKVKYYSIAEWRDITKSIYSSIFSLDLNTSRIYKLRSHESNEKRMAKAIEKGYSHGNWIEYRHTSCDWGKPVTYSVDFDVQNDIMFPISSDISRVYLDLGRSSNKLFIYKPDLTTVTFIENQAASDDEYRWIMDSPDGFSFFWSRRNILIVENSSRKMGVFSDELLNAIVTYCTL